MLRTGQSLAPKRDFVTPLRRQGSLLPPGVSYRGPWRLPRPDSHRLAALSLTLGYTGPSFPSSARATGRTAYSEVELTRIVRGIGAGQDMIHLAGSDF